MKFLTFKIKQNNKKKKKKKERKKEKNKAKQALNCFLLANYRKKLKLSFCSGVIQLLKIPP